MKCIMTDAPKFNSLEICQDLDNNLLKHIKKNDCKILTEETHPVSNGVCKTKELPKKRYILPEREFKHRRSLLIELFEDNVHFKGVYNIFVCFFIIFVLTFFVKEYVHNHRSPAAFTLIRRTFGKLDTVFLLWILNNIFTILMYYNFILWGKLRHKVENKKKWDTICVTALATYYILSFCIVTIIVNKFELPFASSMILSMESVRFLMKLHAFVRSNAGKVLRKDPDTGKNIADLPNITNFLYFLYIPTAVYKDEYPRTKSIHWDFVLYRALEIIGVIIFYAFCFEYIGRPIFGDICNGKSTLLELMVLILEFSVPSVLILWCIFFVLLHSTQNLVAELLRFGDRMFYSDWWTSTDIQQYYRKWNMVIGDWLYTYIHKDICENVTINNRKRNLAKFVTILLSAFVHEWICTVTSGFIFPVLTINMTLSALMCVSFKVKQKNFFIHLIAMFSMIIGSATIASFYGLEYFARLNLSIENSFVPILFTSNCIRIV